MYKIFSMIIPDADNTKKIECLQAELSEKQKAELADIKDKKRRMERVCGEYLILRGLRYLGQDPAGLEIFRPKNRKPHFEGHPSLFFNITHTKDLILCGFSNKELGLDMESKQRKLRDTTLFSVKRNSNEIEDSKDALRSFCAMESYLKLTGKGLSGIKDPFVTDLKKNMVIDTEQGQALARLYEITCFEDYYVYSCHYQQPEEPEIITFGESEI